MRNLVLATTLLSKAPAVRGRTSRHAEPSCAPDMADTMRTLLSEYGLAIAENNPAEIRRLAVEIRALIALEEGASTNQTH